MSRTITRTNDTWTEADGTPVDATMFDHPDSLDRDPDLDVLHVLDEADVTAILDGWDDPQAALSDLGGIVDYSLHYDDVVPTQVALDAYKAFRIKHSTTTALASLEQAKQAARDAGFVLVLGRKVGRKWTSSHWDHEDGRVGSIVAYGVPLLDSGRPDMCHATRYAMRTSRVPLVEFTLAGEPTHESDPANPANRAALHRIPEVTAR